jgi:hypothetical protein
MRGSVESQHLLGLLLHTLSMFELLVCAHACHLSSCNFLPFKKQMVNCFLNPTRSAWSLMLVSAIMPLVSSFIEHVHAAECQKIGKPCKTGKQCCSKRCFKKKCKAPGMAVFHARPLEIETSCSVIAVRIPCIL